MKTKKYKNGGKTNKDSVRTDTLERSVEQVLANARREEEERANSNRNNSGTTSGISGVGRPLIQGTRRAAPEKVTPIAAKKIDSGAGASKKLKKSNVSIPVPGKKKRKRRLKKYDNGGKVTGAKTEKRTSQMLRGMGESNELRNRREQEQIERSVRESNRAKRINEAEARRAKARPDYTAKKVEEGLRDDDGRILSADKLRRKDVTKLEATSPKKEIKKSTVSIPVPGKKRRLIRRK